MKFHANSKDLLDSINPLTKVVGAKNSLPILDTILFEIKGDTLTLTASDIETTIKTELEINSWNKSHEGVSLAIEPKRLVEILKNLPIQPLCFEIEGNQVTLTTDNGKYSLVAMDGADFPSFEIDTDWQCEMSSTVVNEVISKLSTVVSNDELRPVTTGIFFNFAGETLELCATDSHRLITTGFSIFDIAANDSFIMPKKAASLIKSLIWGECPVLIQKSRKNAIFTIGSYVVTFRLIEGQFPDYKKVIPKDNPNKLTINRSELLKSLKRVSLFSNNNSSLIVFDLQKNGLQISAQDIDFAVSAKEFILSEYTGDPLRIGFKSTFLIEMLNNMTENIVEFDFSTPERAVLFYSPFNTNMINLIMPLQIG